VQRGTACTLRVTRARATDVADTAATCADGCSFVGVNVFTDDILLLVINIAARLAGIARRRAKVSYATTTSGKNGLLVKYK